MRKVWRVGLVDSVLERKKNPLTGNVIEIYEIMHSVEKMDSEIFVCVLPPLPSMDFKG